MKYYKKEAIIGLHGEVKQEDVVEAVQFSGYNRCFLELKGMLGPNIDLIRYVPEKNILIIGDSYIANQMDYIMVMEDEIVPVKAFIFESKFIKLDNQ